MSMREHVITHIRKSLAEGRRDEIHQYSKRKAKLEKKCEITMSNIEKNCMKLLTKLRKQYRIRHGKHESLLQEVGLPGTPDPKRQKKLAQIRAIEQKNFDTLKRILTQQIRPPFKFSMEATDPWDSEALVKLSMSGKVLVIVPMFFNKLEYAIHLKDKSIEAKNLGRFMRRFLNKIAKWDEQRR